MKVIFHYLKILKIILRGDYEIGRLKILVCYTKLFFKSIFYHKVKKNKLDVQTGDILGFRVSFFSYAQMLELFEEIFIYEVYKFSYGNRLPFIIDCGSNIGMSILYFKLIFPSSKIIGFEPHAATFGLLQHNINANNVQDVSLFNCALSDLDQTALLHNIRGVGGGLIMSLMEKQGNFASEKIDVKKLSDHIHEKIDLIKIDVEGSENKIIADLIQNGKINLVEKMIIEYHPILAGMPVEKFVALLSKSGFMYNASKPQLHPESSEILISCERLERA